MSPALSSNDDDVDVDTGEDATQLDDAIQFGEGASVSPASGAGVDLSHINLTPEYVDDSARLDDPTAYKDAASHSEENDATAEDVDFPSPPEDGVPTGDGAVVQTEDDGGPFESNWIDRDPGDFAEVEAVESVQTEIADDFFEDG